MIKEARERLGISQAQLAKLVGLSNQAVSKWESMQEELIFKNDQTQKAVSAVIKMTPQGMQRRLRKM